MKRLALVLLCLLVTADAATAQTWRFKRLIRPPVAGGPEEPPPPPPPPPDPSVCTITTPVSSVTFTTPDTSIPVGGVCTPDIVTCSYDTSLGVVDGTCTFTATGIFAISAASVATVFNDPMDSSVSGPLNSHTPITGGAWTTLYTSSGSNFCRILSADVALPQLTENNGARMLCQLAPNPALGAATAWDFSLKLSNGTGVVWGPHAFGQNVVLAFGIAASNPQDNLCGFTIYDDSLAVDVKGWKKVSGTTTTLASLNIAPVAGDVFRVHRDGNVFTLFQNDVERGSFTDAACAATNTMALGFGAFIEATEDIVTTSYVDDIVVVNQSGGSGVALSAGDQTITVEGCRADGVCVTDSIVVTQGVADTTSPDVLTVVTPVGDPINTATQPTFTLTGHDNIGIDHYSFSCNNSCSPASGNFGGGESATLSTITFASGTTTLTLCAHDAAANTPLCLTRTIVYNPSDVTDPTIAITTGCSGPVTVGTVTCGGTAADTGGSGLASPPSPAVVCTNTTSGTSFNASGSTNWNVTVGLVSGANDISCKSFDSAGNDSIAATASVTYSVPLSITTASPLANAPKDVAYSVTLASTGGTLPHTWVNHSTGTSNLVSSDAQCAGLTVSSAGVISGTPTVAGDCVITYRVTDNVAGTATKALTIPVVDLGAATGGTDHTLFDSLCALSSFYICESLRNDARLQALSATTSWAKAFSYDPANDPNPQRQDAAKMRVPAWPSTLEANTVSGQQRLVGVQIEPGDTTVTLNVVDSTIQNGLAFKINDEIFVCVPPTVTTHCRGGGATPTGQTYHVRRGTYGTTPAQHLVGAYVRRANNSVPNVINRQLAMADETANYLFVWDEYFTDSFLSLNTPGNTTGVGGGTLWGSVPMTHYKGMRFIAGGPDNLWIEIDTDFTGGTSVSGASPACCLAPNWFAGTHVGSSGSDGWDFTLTAQSPWAFNVKPPTPQVNVVRFAPGKWIRKWLFLEQNKDEDTLTVDLTTLTNGIDADTTTITFNAPIANFPSTPGCANCGQRLWASTALHSTRPLKIDNEIVTITNCALTGVTRSCTVSRGQHGTQRAPHDADATVKASWDYITMYIATEDSPPVKTYDRYPVNIPQANGNPQYRNRITKVQWAWNTSTDGVIEQRRLNNWEDLVMYFKDFSVNKNVPTTWDTTLASTYLLQPRNTVPTLVTAQRYVCAAGNSTCGGTPAYTTLALALAAAVSGDIVCLKAGETFTATTTLPNKGALASAITIRSCVADSFFPDDGYRITNAHFAYMPTLVSGTNNVPTIMTAVSAQDYTLKFLRIKGDPVATGTMVRLGINDSTQQFVSDQPQDITIDRVVFDGDPIKGQKRGVEMNGVNLTVKNSSFYNIGGVGQDAQGMAAFNGMGPITFTNNYVEAAAENFIVGGDDPQMYTSVSAGVGSTTTVLVYNPATFRSGHTETAHVFGAAATLIGHRVAVQVGADALEHATVTAYDTTANTITIDTDDDTVGNQALSGAPASGYEISWGAVFDGVTVEHNLFEHKRTWHDYVLPGTGGVTATAAVGGGTLVAGTYCYRVTARAVGYSGSTIDGVPPAEVCATLADTGRVIVQWAPVAAASTYRVFGRTTAAQDQYWDVSAPTVIYVDTGTAGTAGTVSAVEKFTQKNLGEIKQGIDVTIRYNVFRYARQNTTFGATRAFWMKSVNQSDTAPYMETTRVEFAYNWLTEVAACLEVSASEQNSGLNIDLPRPIEDLNVHDNLCAPAGAAYNQVANTGTASSNITFSADETTHGAKDVTFENNAMLGTRHSIYFQNSAALRGTNTFRSNAFIQTSNQIFGDTSLSGSTALTAYGVGTFTNNIIPGASSGSYPANNQFPTQTALQTAFFNFNGTAIADFAWDAGHAYNTGGHDGAQIGPDLTTLATEAAKAIAGTP